MRTAYAARMRALRWRGRLLPLVTERRTDAAVTAVLLGFALPTVPWWWRPRGHGGPVWSILGDLALALAQSLPFLARRRHPVLIAATVAAAMAAATVFHLKRDSLTVAAFAAAYGVGAFVRTGHPWGRRLGTLTLLACGAAAFEVHRPGVGAPLVSAGVGFLVGEAAVQHRRDTAAAVAAAHLAERNRIARDLHDVLAHQLTAIAVQAGSARVALRTAPEPPGGDEARRVEPTEVLGVVERLAREALGELGHLLGVLRSEPDDVLARRPAPSPRAPWCPPDAVRVLTPCHDVPTCERSC